MVFIGLREQDEDMSRIKADRDSAVKVKKTRRDPTLRTSGSKGGGMAKKLHLEPKHT
jgi:hypothetical protein